MEKWSIVTGNIYLWLFVSALFAGVSLNFLIASVYSFFKKDKLWSRRMPAFYIFLSIAVGVVTVSYFYADWAETAWIPVPVVFFAVFTLVWGLVFRFLFPWGIGAVVLMAGAAVFLNYMLLPWQNTDQSPEIVRMRLLSEQDSVCEYEITGYNERTWFYTAGKGEGRIAFYRLDLSPVLFFIPGRTFFFLSAGEKSIPHFIGILEFLADKTGIADLESADFKIPFMLMLREYVISFSRESDRFIFKIIH